LLVRIDDGLPRLLTSVPLDKSFEADSNGLGARGCHAFIDESVDSGQQPIVHPSNKLRHPPSIAMCHAGCILGMGALV
jgi:hypothetical protein